MATEVSWLDVLMKYGLFFGAIFQLVCIFAIVIFPGDKCSELEEHNLKQHATEDRNTKLQQQPRTKTKLRDAKTRKRR